MTARFVAGRIGWAAFVLFGSSIVIFLILHVIPGDPARAMLGPEGTDEAIARLRVELGLDEPLVKQYVIWLGNAVRGDLGRSILLSQSVSSLLAERLPITLALGLYALVYAVALAIPLSVLSATSQGSVVDYAGRLAGLLGFAMPSFWLGLMLVLLFGVILGWLPVFGYVRLSEDPVLHLKHMVLPVLALGSAYAAMIMETTRSSLIEVLQQDYIRTARAVGLREPLVLYKYAIRNALIPTVTVIGIQVGYLMSGAVVVESVFAIPGMGRLLVSAVLARDYPVVQGAMLVTVAVFSLANLCVDILYAVIDPRVRRQ